MSTLSKKKFWFPLNGVFLWFSHLPPPSVHRGSRSSASIFNLTSMLIWPESKRETPAGFYIVGWRQTFLFSPLPVPIPVDRFLLFLFFWTSNKKKRIVFCFFLIPSLFDRHSLYVIGGGWWGCRNPISPGCRRVCVKILWEAVRMVNNTHKRVIKK